MGNYGYPTKNRLLNVVLRETAFFIFTKIEIDVNFIKFKIHLHRSAVRDIVLPGKKCMEKKKFV